MWVVLNEDLVKRVCCMSCYMYVCVYMLGPWILGDSKAPIDILEKENE